MAQPDSKQDHEADRQKLALPVLKRFEPEARGREIAEHGHLLKASMRYLLLVISARAARRVQEKAYEEEQQKDEAQRILVEPEGYAAFAHGPRRILFVRRFH